jgi:signal transduction histidine kinase
MFAVLADSYDLQPVSPRLLTALAAVCGAAVTFAAAAVPSLYLAYRLPIPLRGVVEMTITISAGLVAFLALGRSRQRLARHDVVVAVAFGAFAFANLVLPIVARVSGDATQPVFSLWANVTCEVFGAAILALAAHWLLRSSHTRVVTAALAFAFVAIVAVAIGVMTSSHIPATIAVARPGTARSLQVSGNPFVVAPPLLVAAYYALAALAFARRSDRDADEFWGWLGAGCALSAAASVNSALFPPLGIGFYTADILRLGAALLWLTGCGREIASYWAGWSRLLVVDERRRIARDLHDGLAQELAFIATQVGLLERGAAAGNSMQQVGAAARRALTESRRAIRALSSGDEPLEVALAQVAEEVALRERLRLHLALDPGIVAGPSACDALARIVSEAITNAGRHGHASAVTVELSNGNGYRLRVSDNGIGFDPVAQEAHLGGFGLVSMRERAAIFGADFAIRARRGSGATIEVAWT